MTTKRKPGRPRIDKPPKLAQRPKRIEGGVVVKVTITPDLLATIDAAAAARGVTRAGWIRGRLEESFTHHPPPPS